MATATIRSGGTCRWGPNTNIYPIDNSSSLDAGETVTVLWQEGDFYYLEYKVTGTNKVKRMYYPKNKVNTPSGSVPVRNFDKGVRYVTVAGSVLYSPNVASPSAGSLGRLESVRFLSEAGSSVTKENGFAFVEYTVTNTNTKKRAWFPSATLRLAPNITSPSTVYASTSALSSSQQTANATYIFNYLRDLGISKQAACAILGNIQAESGINPGIWEVVSDPPATTSDGYGLIQWTPATNFLNHAVDDGIISAATKSAINNYASSNPKGLMAAEMECLIWCFVAHGDYLLPSETGETNNTGYEMTFSEFISSSLPAATLAIVFHDHYVRSNNPFSLDEREEYATYWYNQLA